MAINIPNFVIITVSGESKLDYCMRQEHRGGEKVFVDYSDGLTIVDALNGEIITTQLFVAVWGASNYTYAEATLSQTLPEWIRSHVHALEYFQCAPRVWVSRQSQEWYQQSL